MSRGTGLLLLSVLLQAGYATEGSRFGDLLANSPFVASTLVAETTSDAQLEFCGYSYTGETALFCITRVETDPRRSSAWVGLAEPNGDYIVRSFDQASETVQIERRGRLFTLQLKQNRVRLMLLTTTSDIISTEGLHERTASLEAVAAEIRRRRAARQAQLAHRNDRAQTSN